MPSAVVVAGHIDRTVVKAICPDLHTPEPEEDEPQGREAAIRRAAIATKLLGQDRIVLLLDPNGYSRDEIEKEVLSIISQHVNQEPRRKGTWYLCGQSAIRIVLAGLPSDNDLRALGCSRFMIDDYLLKLCLTDEALSAFCRGESQVAYRPQKASELESIIGRLAVELGKAGISVDSSKRYLDLIRATIGFAASRARFAELLISRSPQHLLSQMFGALRNDIATDPPIDP